MRVSDPPAGWRVAKTCSDGGVVYRPAGEDPGRDPKRPKDWPALARFFAESLTEGSLKELAARLGVSADALRRLGCGHRTDGSFTFPERDGSGTVVGILRRRSDGGKRAMKGGRRGLIIPDGLEELPDPVLLVEGPSDVAAGLTLGG